MRRYNCKSEDQINIRHEIQFRKDIKFLKEKVKQVPEATDHYLEQFLKQHYDIVSPNPNLKKVLLQFLDDVDSFSPLDFLMEELQN